MDIFVCNPAPTTKIRTTRVELSAPTQEIVKSSTGRMVPKVEEGAGFVSFSATWEVHNIIIDNKDNWLCLQ